MNDRNYGLHKDDEPLPSQANMLFVILVPPVAIAVIALICALYDMVTK